MGCEHDGIRRTLALKEKNPDLKVLFSVGGWTAGGWIFSDMAQTRERRQMFIQSAVHFMNYFGLDGIDLDWEFPAYDMLPEVPTDPLDREHFSLLMKEMGDAFKKHNPPYLLTFAAAADPYKANNAYYLDEVHPHVDWFNVMAYDYHGAWDNFTGIDQPSTASGRRALSATLCTSSTCTTRSSTTSTTESHRRSLFLEFTQKAKLGSSNRTPRLKTVLDLTAQPGSTVQQRVLRPT